jgi:hypothetical protein
MKKFLPFVFPAIALAIVLFLAVRWYNSRTVRDNGQITEFAEGVKIEDLTQAEMNNLRGMANNEKTVELKGTDDMSGQVRYEMKDGRIYFSVYATLPELTVGHYQVWLKQVNGDSKRKAFILEMNKGGYMGSAAISADTLPFEVVVSKEVNNDDIMEVSLLHGVVQKDEVKK